MTLHVRRVHMVGFGQSFAEVQLSINLFAPAWVSSICFQAFEDIFWPTMLDIDFVDTENGGIQTLVF